MPVSPYLRLERAGHVSTVTFERAPHNFVCAELLGDLADALLALDADASCRAVVLAAAGPNFCAGADFAGKGSADGPPDPAAIYTQAMRLFETRKPIVAALHGAAVGAGAGLALVADFRIAAADARISFNFNRLGIHPGFGLSVTLPRLVGGQRAAMLFYTARRVDATQALALGLVDEVVPPELALARAQALAAEIAASQPQAVQTTRATLRDDLADRVREANHHELAEQRPQFESADFREGVQAMTERRLPVFRGL